MLLSKRIGGRTRGRGDHAADRTRRTRFPRSFPKSTTAGRQCEPAAPGKPGHARTEAERLAQANARTDIVERNYREALRRDERQRGEKEQLEEIERRTARASKPATSYSAKLRTYIGSTDTEGIELAVSLPTDIVMDVARAADPQEVQRPASDSPPWGQPVPSRRQNSPRPSQGSAPERALRPHRVRSSVRGLRAAILHGKHAAGRRRIRLWRRSGRRLLEIDDGRAACQPDGKGGRNRHRRRILADHYARAQDKPAMARRRQIRSEKREAEARNLTSQAIVHEIQRRSAARWATASGLLTDRKQG
jgi:hypothetical protein